MTTTEICRNLFSLLTDCQNVSRSCKDLFLLHPAYIDVMRLLADSCCFALKVPLLHGINRTIEFFRSELQRQKHSERNIWQPEYLKGE